MMIATPALLFRRDKRTQINVGNAIKSWLYEWAHIAARTLLTSIALHAAGVYYRGILPVGDVLVLRSYR